jgi:hypothetical protein
MSATIYSRGLKQFVASALIHLPQHNLDKRLVVMRISQAIARYIYFPPLPTVRHTIFAFYKPTARQKAYSRICICQIRKYTLWERNSRR